MAQENYRGNLSSATFPLISTFQGRSVIVARIDQNYVPAVASSAEPDKDRGIPQAFYCHNVMPTMQGYQSISYNLKLDNTGIGHQGPIPFVNIYVLYPGNGNVVFVTYDPLTGRLYSYDTNGGALYWSVTYNNLPLGATITTAKVNGIAYIYISTYGCLVYDPLFQNFTLIPLTGLVAANILGIVSAYGYLIAWDKGSIAWSSTVSATDFTPSLITGAGGGSIEQAEGSIVTCIPVGLGIIIYTNYNAVSAVYSGNSRFPFNFKELLSVGGILNPEVVGYGQEGITNYAYTTHGMQSVSINQVVNVFPELVDFLTCKYIEDFDFVTNLPIQIPVNVTLLKRVVLISARYLVISYGITSYTHALVYDISLKRWGKLRFTHVAIFELPPNSFSGPNESSRVGIGALIANGSIYAVDFRLHEAEAVLPAVDSILILGKFQLSRNNLIQMIAVELESFIDRPVFQTYVIPSLDGKTFSPPILGVPLTSSPKISVCNFRVTALNHSVMIKGAFNISTIILAFTSSARR